VKAVRDGQVVSYVAKRLCVIGSLFLEQSVCLDHIQDLFLECWEHRSFPFIKFDMGAYLRVMCSRHAPNYGQKSDEKKISLSRCCHMEEPRLKLSQIKNGLFRKPAVCERKLNRQQSETRQIGSRQAANRLLD